MGKTGAFLTTNREDHGLRPCAETAADWDEFVRPLPADRQQVQASRCMNCGVAFCQGGAALQTLGVPGGCPLGNLIPETNDLLYRNRWDDAAGRLFLTNPFPEFTGRVCPSPCEAACNLGVHDDPVTIHDNERALADHAWERGIEPLPAPAEGAPVVAVVGSGPAGLAAAWELARLGYAVRVHERADRAGGLLMYGIPSMKLPKDVVERRLHLMQESGIAFSCNDDACENAEAVAAGADAVVIAAGATVARRLDVPGADLDGVHQAVEYLTEITRAQLEGRSAAIDAAGKDVVVVGGGDTGVDCVAAALRQGARSVAQVIRAARPADACDDRLTWPVRGKTCTQGYGQREAEKLFGADPRIWSVETLEFVDDGTGTVGAVRIADRPGAPALAEGSERQLPAQLVLIAKGFTGADPTVFEAFGVQIPERRGDTHLIGFTAAPDTAAEAADETARDIPVFVAGDARTGSTLVSAAMADALRCAAEVHAHLQNQQ